MKRNWSVLSLVFCSLLIVFDFAHAGQEASVETFSPQGTVKEIRQVAVRFSEQMVPFGNARLVEPFEINCPEKGKARWADGKNWIYDFDRDIPAGVVCEFSLKPDLRTLSGRTMAGQKRFSFSTGGPAIKISYPREGDERIDEEQIFVLALDAVPDEESIVSHASCQVEGINERVGVRILKGMETEKLLKLRQFEESKDMPRIVLRCRQNFPNDSVVKLIWGKGVKSASGVETAADQVLSFKVRSPFIASFGCERENANAGCIPILPMRLQFSSPVPWKSASKVFLKGHDKTYKPEKISRDEDEEGAAEDQDATDENSVGGITFKGPFPENSTFVIELPKDLGDDAGRGLSNADSFPLTVRTDSFPPLAKFSARFGVIELKGDAVLPVTLRNLEPEVKTRKLKIEGEGNETVEGVKGRLRKIGTDKEEKIIDWLRAVASAERKTSILKDGVEAKEFSIPKPGGAKAFEVVGIPLKEPGLYVVEMESRILGESLLGEQKPMYVPTAALVTNLSAHFKWGRESSLVWVTNLDKSETVRGVDIHIRDCKGTLIWRGRTDGNGIARIRKHLPSEEDLPRCSFSPNYSEAFHALEGIGGGLFVFAKTANDMTFVHSSWSRGIEPWRFNLPGESYEGPYIGHSIFDRSLLRAGETVHMKHILRKHTMSGFSLVRAAELPNTVTISHQGSDQTYELPLRWDRKGIAESKWKIPVDTKLGYYEVTLSKKTHGKPKSGSAVGGQQEGDEESLNQNVITSGRFRVEEFRVPLMKGLIQPPKEPSVNAREVDVDLYVGYLSGGGAGSIPVKLRSQIQPRYVSFPDYEDFTIANGGVKEETIRRSSYEELEAEQAKKAEARVRTKELMLDKSGGLRTRIQDLPPGSTPNDISTEMEFRDPNGEVQTVSTKIPLWPSMVLVGIKPDSWASSKESFKFQVIALDISGKPLKGRDLKVDLLQRKYYSHRKRLVGGFYSYEHVTETKKVAAGLCEGKTDDKGLLICDVHSPVSGNVILQARAADDEGNVSVAYRDVWIAGKDEWWFDVSDNDRIDLLPEKKRYEPGDTAKFQLRMPFRRATALVTVEREGLMEAFVKKLSGKNPLIEILVRKNYAPNVFVSALVVRGRVSDVQPTAMVDLGKPAFKLGIAEINVGWKGHELKVNVSPERDVYKIREKSRVHIRVRRPDGSIPPKGSEVSVAAVDEGLLELMPNKSWNLLEAMMGRRGYEVRTCTVQMQVVGKRHYGLKALPPGGGGGKQVTRELFDTLLLWKGRVPLNSEGEAVVEIPLNDSLTSFRIAAVATGGVGLFGTGHASIRTTQDLMILSGIPPLVREGDKFRAGFTIRNASGRKMDLDVRAKIKASEEKELEPVRETLAAGESREIGWKVQVPYGVENLGYEIEAKEKDGDARDSLKVKQKVAEAVSVRVFQATTTQVEKNYNVAVERPKDALPGKGGVSVSFRPKISDGMDGVVRYMKHYPYSCMEQKVSRAVALRDDALWKNVIAEMPSYLDQDGLVKYFPTSFYGSDTLTSYVYSIAHEAGWTIPDNVREKMEDGLKGFIEGRIIRYSSLPTADLSIRRIAAMEALSRTGKAEAKMLGSIMLEPNLWPTSAVIDWLNVLVRVQDIPNRDVRLKEAEQIIRSRLNFQGTTMGFSTEGTDYLWWLMVSADVNAVRSVLAFLQFDSWNQDMPRLVKGALGRQYKGAWALTTANAWGVLAMEKFSKKFESIPVTGTTSATLDEKTKSVHWKESGAGRSVMLDWPKTKEELTITHLGTGRPWATVQSLAAIPLKELFSSGYRIRKTLMPVDQKEKGKWSRGDVVRVKLEVEAQADMTWVVVNDPVPAGSNILGTGLGRDSAILTTGEEYKGWVWPVFEERSFDSFKAYYEFVPKGKWVVEYTVRLNNAGTFNLPPTRVEALYAPEMLGEKPNGTVEIGQ
jgi:uncharacterized protein YfaS (alpha-2-macroglobulin family)